MASNNSESPYLGSGSLTRAQFLFYEMRIVANLLLEGLTNEEIRERVVRENLFQYPTERSIKGMVRVCLSRLHGLDDDRLVAGIAQSDSFTAKQICLYANHTIDRITPHCVVGQCTVQGLGDWMALKSTQASCNYGIDRDGRVGMYVEEKNRSWCSSSSENDNRAVTIECASDTTEPYAFKDMVYQTLIKLCIDICRRNGKKKLLWLGDKSKTLSYSPRADEMILTVHRWYANKSCPGDWMMARMGDLASKVTAQLGGSTEMQASELAGLSEAEVVRKVGSLFTADQKKSGILACVSMAQFILESGYGSTDLTLNANNCFGMKKVLSGNTWPGSTWDGKSVYTKKTKEDDGNGNLYSVTADFRKYPCVEDSISDHSAYLLGAKNGDKPRYDGLKGCTDYRNAIQIIKDGGYATDTKYVAKLCSIIERWNLTQYDLIENWYRVRKSWGDAASQIGAFVVLANAKAVADANPGYSVFDHTGKRVYTPPEDDDFPETPFMVRVSSGDTDIYPAPGTNYPKTGLTTGEGIFTIVEISKGPGSFLGWGRLKSGAGWIALDDTTRV